MPPSSKRLRTTLLVKAKRQVEKMLEPIKATWPSFGVSIVSDGWTGVEKVGIDKNDITYIIIKCIS
jgi:hypothetical protein